MKLLDFFNAEHGLCNTCLGSRVTNVPRCAWKTAFPEEYEFALQKQLLVATSLNPIRHVRPGCVGVTSQGRHMRNQLNGDYS